MGILNKIRQKSDNEKKILSLISAVVLTLVIVVVWSSFTSSSASDNEVDAQDKLSSISPMQVIKDEFSKLFSTLGSNIKASSSTTTVPIEIIKEETGSPSLGTSTEISTTTTTIDNNIN
ncbi:MAG: hypothetical protein WCP24_01075 [bacterium]